MTLEQARKILGVSTTDSADTIRDAYRELAKVWHPDRFASESESLRTRAQDQMTAVNEAYRVLNNSPGMEGEENSNSAAKSPNDPGPAAGGSSSEGFKPKDRRTTANANDAGSDRWNRPGYVLLAAAVGISIFLLFMSSNSWQTSRSDPNEQYLLGRQYANGDGVPKDAVQAVAWYRKAAEQGHASAQHNLGLMYYRGDGVPKDAVQAVAWFRKAAEQGHASAQYTLGVMYANGEGVPKDAVQAVAWYRKAAEQGDASVQHNLGLMYYRGDGVPKDIVLAYMWINQAAAQNGENGKKARDALEILMTPAQIAEAQKLSRERTPKK